MLSLGHFNKIFASIIFLSVTISSFVSKQNILDIIFESIETEAFGEVCGYADCLEVNDDSANVYQYGSVVIDVLQNDVEVPESGTDDIVLGSSFCNTQTNQVINTASNGTVVVNSNSITYTPNPGFVGTDSFIYCASLGPSYGFGNVNITVFPVQQLQLNLYKDKADNQTKIGDKVKVQATVTNPNNFTIENALVTINLNSSEVEMVQGSATFGQIQGQKFSYIKNLLTGPEVMAYTGGVINESQNQITVNFATLSANETVDITFDLVLKVQRITQLSGVASFGTTPQSTDQLQIIPFSVGLFRTGGNDQKNFLKDIFQYIAIAFGLFVSAVVASKTYFFKKR